MWITLLQYVPHGWRRADEESLNPIGMAKAILTSTPMASNLRFNDSNGDKEDPNIIV